MRTKIFALSMGLAASVWLTGCQFMSPTKDASCGSGNAACKTGCKDGSCKASSGKDASCKDGSCKSGGCKDGCKDSLHTDLNRGEKNERIARALHKLKTPSAVPAAPCTTCAKPGSPAVAAKSTEVTAADCSCAAKTGSATIVPASNVQPQAVATLPPTMPHVSQSIAPPPPMPTQETIGIVAGSGPMGIVPASSGAAPAAMAPVNYGPGVEVVSGGQPAPIPTTTTVIPGPQPSGKNEMTVRFGQANNYQIVVGEIYQFRRAWKLRYTAVESDDRYGGSLTLVGDNLDNLKDGQIVQVEGSVIPSDDRVGGTRYQVTRVQVLEPNVK